MTTVKYEKALKSYETDIPGLILFDIPVHGDNRGWFKENYQREKMIEVGIPKDFMPVQNNVSFNAKKGVTRGIHAEPWDKFISLASGKVFGAWVDLRAGDSFGKVFTCELDPSKAIFVPRGVGNSFQALEDNTTYTYLVNEHWNDKTKYTFVNLNDKEVSIKWPIELADAEVSEKDKKHPSLSEVIPIKPKKILVTGGNGQLGKALKIEFPDAEFTDSDALDITDPEIEKQRNWCEYSTIINAAAFTAVDKAETSDGRKMCWKINACAVANLAKLANKYNLCLVHVSSDYVFNGEFDDHQEDEDFNPLNVYGQTKAAGDIAASLANKHYILRTSWVVGKGNNFVRTMIDLANKGVKPSVVNDQIGRLTFTDQLASAIKYVVTQNADYGTYNISGDGEPASWADIAKKIYELSGSNAKDVTGVTTEEYYKDKESIAPRPLISTLDLTKIKKIGFKPKNWQDSLIDYINNKDCEA